MPHTQIAPSDTFDVPVLARAEEPEREPTDLQGLVKRQIEEALQWAEEHLDPELEKATDYYKARPYGDEREGRSQVVTTDVRDAVLTIMPSLLRVFTGSERTVEFKPRGAEDEALARQQTDYVNYVFQEDNPGFLILHSALKDALVRKIGGVKWWWEEEAEVVGSEHTGITPEAVAVLEDDPDVTEIEVLAEYPAEDDPERVYMDVAIKRMMDDGRCRIAAVPPEELLWSPGARSLEEASMVAHIQHMPASDLLAMGAPPDLVEETKGQDTRLATNRLAMARQIDEGDRSLFEDETDDSMRPVFFAEVYTKVDTDGDGIAELRRVQCIGDNCEIWTDELVDEVPFALFMPDPEPHTIAGLSVADYVMDLQRITSHVTRGMLDSLVAHINPSMEVNQDNANMKDVLNQEIGRIIRVRGQIGQVREIPTEFVGAAALPVLEKLEEQKASRVGVTNASAGLDPDALQSTTRAGVSATVQAAQQRLELLARILAETGMKRMFKGILRTVVQHQDWPRTVRLRNEYVEVDPRHWDADMDVRVNVALGTGLVEEKMQMLSLIADKQEQHIQMGSPLVGMEQLRATYARMIELMGFSNSNEFFRPFGPQEAAQYAQMQAQNQEPSEAERLERIEMSKIQQRSQEKMAELRLKAAELQLERMKLARELGLEEAKAEAEIGARRVDQAIEQAKVALDARSKAIDGIKKMSETRVGDDA